MDKSFLTEQQFKVLKLRRKGLTQKEISHILGTTRVNVSTIEKRAKDNIEKSKNTLRKWNKLISPLRIDILEGVDVLDIPKKIFNAINEKDIKLKYNTIELISIIEREKKSCVHGRLVSKNFIIYVTEQGDILLE